MKEDQQNTIIINKLRYLLADITGNHVEEILADSHLQDDLGINLMEDFSRIMAQINSEFEISLKIEEVLDELEAAGEIVEELAKLVVDEMELG